MSGLSLEATGAATCRNGTDDALTGRAGLSSLGRSCRQLRDDAGIFSAETVPRRGVKRDRAGNRHVQALAVRRNLDPNQAVAVLARKVAKTGSLGAEDDAEPLDAGKMVDRRLAPGGKPGDMDAVLLQPLDGAGKIDHPDHGNMFERACRCAGQRPGFFGRVAMCRHHRGRAERQTASQNGADIARVGQLVEKQDADRIVT